jgi:hypothetical protein
VTFVGGSKDEVLDSGEDDNPKESDEGETSEDGISEREDLEVCDLCGSEYESDAT